LKLFVYEHVSGGGFAGKSLPSSILSEGFGMLRTLISDFKTAGYFVTTMLDSRLATLNPPIEADCMVPVFSSRDAEAAFQKISESADAAYIIAPESNHVLQSLVANLEQAGVSSLNCQASAIGEVSDKAVFHESLKRLGLPTPKTVIISTFDDVAEIKQTVNDRLEFPLIFKPVDGVSCGGLSVVRNGNQVAIAVSKIGRESSSKRFVAQELIRGVAISVSLISTGSEALPISLNRQDVSLGTPNSISTYQGGLVPFDNPLKPEAFAMAEQAAKFFRGLRGYIGVDLVLTEKEPVVIEVNPRLTTSYVGVRKVASFNPAQALINSILKRELPENNQGVGYAFFSKVEIPKPTAEVLQKTYGMDEVVSPPFPVSDNDAASALVLSQRATLKEAMVGFHEAKKRLLSITCEGEWFW
jgi:predicted ATP-grasp superfamily ATP-dependent carboligase